jgi:hypothetical protein
MVIPHQLSVLRIVNHRPKWYNMICGYNINDKAKLAKGILESQIVMLGCEIGLKLKNVLNRVFSI